MKKLLFILTFTFLSVFVFAQNQEFAAKSHYFKVVAGVNLSNYYGKGSTEFDNKFGYRAGIFCNALTKKRIVGIQCGLIVTDKGAKSDLSSAGYGTLTVDEIYLEVPAEVTFNIPLSKGSGNNFLIGVGCYVSYGIAGKSKINSGSSDTFGGSVGIEKWDSGIVGEVGLDLGHFSVGVNCDLGLCHIKTTSGDWPYNISYSLNVGYRF